MFWNRDRSFLLGGFFLLVLLIVYIWWPLAEEYLAYMDWRGSWWLYMDWLLVGIFTFMTITLVAGADLRKDLLIVIVALIGGLVIEAWGTQTNLWFYYTAERPPLWIIPAWPISTLSIDRITRFLNKLFSRSNKPVAGINKRSALRSIEEIFFWVIFIAFIGIMLKFIAPTLNKPFSWFALLICIYLIVTAQDHGRAILVFIAGTCLGYFLELWGTTRECWTYYTFQTPPLFAVLAHGMAAVAFWRSGMYLSKTFALITSLVGGLRVSNSSD
jgi:hypothetical protein